MRARPNVIAVETSYDAAMTVKGHAAIAVSFMMDEEPRAWRKAPNEFAGSLLTRARAPIETNAAKGTGFDVDVFGLDALFVAVHEADDIRFELIGIVGIVGFDHDRCFPVSGRS